MSWHGWLTHSGRFTHISGHPSATGRAQDRESTPAEDRRSTTEPRNQLAKARHHTSAGTKLYCWVTEAHACEQLAQGCYLEADRPRFEPATFRIASERNALLLTHTCRPLVLVIFRRKCTSASPSQSRSPRSIKVRKKTGQTDG